MKVIVEVPDKTQAISVTTIAQPKVFDVYALELATHVYTIGELEQVDENDT